MTQQPDGTEPKSDTAPVQQTTANAERPRLADIANVGGVTYENLPLERRATLVAQQSSHSWQGPYPPPEAAERFEKLAPGSFNRILTMAEKAQAAEIVAMSNAQTFVRRDTRRGHILGAILSILAMGGTLVCLHWGYPWVASLFLSVPVMAVVKALIEPADTSRRRGLAHDDESSPD